MVGVICYSDNAPEILQTAARSSNHFSSTNNFLLIELRRLTKSVAVSKPFIRRHLIESNYFISKAKLMNWFILEVRSIVKL
jgi:hypothetical protein